MQRTTFLRALPLCLGVLMGCGADDPTMAFPDDDAAVVDDTVTTTDPDAGPLPTFDVPELDHGNPTVLDVPASVDRGVTVDRGTVVDNGVVSTDHGGTMACPSSCSADDNCAPCRTSTDPASLRYCCLSGLCISMTGACPTTMGGGGTDGGGGGGDGGGGDGGGGDGGGGAD